MNDDLCPVGAAPQGPQFVPRGSLSALQRLPPVFQKLGLLDKVGITSLFGTAGCDHHVSDGVFLQDGVRMRSPGQESCSRERFRLGNYGKHVKLPAGSTPLFVNRVFPGTAADQSRVVEGDLLVDGDVIDKSKFGGRTRILLEDDGLLGRGYNALQYLRVVDNVLYPRFPSGISLFVFAGIEPGEDVDDLPVGNGIRQVFGLNVALNSPCHFGQRHAGWGAKQFVVIHMIEIDPPLCVAYRIGRNRSLQEGGKLQE